MIKVNCIVNSVDAGDKKALSNERQLVVESIKNGGYGEVMVTLGDSKIVVNGDDLLSAIDNCRNSGRPRVYRGYRDRDRDNSNSEEE